MAIIMRFMAIVLSFLSSVAMVAAQESTGAYIPVFPLHWIRVHGWLMWLSMGLLMPVGIILVRFSQRAREQGDLKTVRTLVYVHIYVQAAAVLLSICGAVVGFVKFDNTFHYTHERLGLALYILVWLAPLVGFIRPDNGVRSRPVWYATHWIFGTAGVLLGFYNIYTGLTAYEHMTSKSLRTVNILFSIQLGVVALIYLSQDRWQYLKQQGTLSKPVAPVHSNQKPKHGTGNEGHHIQVIPLA